MLNNKNNIVVSLKKLGLSTDEAKIYLALLESPMSHLELARKTKINRTKVYRIADDLKAKSLVTVKQRDDGKFLAAAEPSNLEIGIANLENVVAAKKRELDLTLPVLGSIFNNGSLAVDFFTVNTYEGVAGLKQMLWNELKTKGEICIFSHDVLDGLAGTAWAEKFRAKVLEAGIAQRSLENSDSRHVLERTSVDYTKVYCAKYLPRSVFDIKQELSIHDDTVSIYNWRGKEDALRVGVEIKNQDFANFMKAIFENYWKIAK